MGGIVKGHSSQLCNIANNAAIAATGIIIVRGVALLDAEDALLAIQNDEHNEVENELGHMIEV